MSEATPVVDMKETIEVIAFLEGFAAAIKGAESDGVINIKDAHYLPGLGLLAKDAGFGLDKIDDEWKGANGELKEKAFKDMAGAALSLFEAVLIVLGKK